MANTNQRIQLIEHKGKTIIYVSYRGCSKDTEAEFLQTIDDVAKLMMKRGPNQLTLTDVNDCFGSSTIVAKFKEVTVITKALRKKAAVLGVSGAKTILLNAINMFSKSNMKAFSNIEEAKDWLVKD